jgi:hypothetical protein
MAAFSSFTSRSFSVARVTTRTFRHSGLVVKLWAIFATTAIIASLWSTPVSAQPQPTGGQPGGQPGRGGGRQERKILEEFDTNKSGRLEEAERRRARQYQQANPPARRGRGGAGRRPVPGGIAPNAVEGRKLEAQDVARFPHQPMYDGTLLRTFFLDFEAKDWESELADFYRTDVMVPATLTVDSVEHEGIGVSFRGNSSFFTLSDGQKRSLNLAVDYSDDTRDLYGYRTINLLNAHSDASFLREVVYNHIARNYTPAPKANFVHLVINSASWGIYINVQQFNKDFTKEWFGSRGGIRWKVPAGSRRGLGYYGESADEYTGFELKSNVDRSAMVALIKTIRQLNEIPIEQLDVKLDAALNLDRALWLLALDNVLLDIDGYHTRGSDFVMYQELPSHRLHVLPYDSNETFRFADGGGGAFSGPSGAAPPRSNSQQAVATGSFELSPFEGKGNSELPLASRLLENPRLRARYVAHVRTLRDQWLDWENIGPVIEKYHNLISEEVARDARKLYPSQAFDDSIDINGTGRRPTPGLRRFVEGRREYLDSIAELNVPHASITKLTHGLRAESPMGSRSIRVAAQLSSQAEQAEEVWLHYATTMNGRFRSLAMADDGQHADGAASDNVWGGEIPPQELGATVKYYVEARTALSLGTTVFEPASTEVGAVRVYIEPTSDPDAVVINEVLPSNRQTLKDSAGDYDDWIELHNTSKQTALLTGMYLTDTLRSPRKWKFPAGTSIGPNEYLIVWADEEKKEEGLHANFKLAKQDEAVYLIDSDERGNLILDSLKWGNLRPDVAFGRRKNGKKVPMVPTPNGENR